MSFIINVKNSQSEFMTTGHLFQNTYYVDDSIKDGLELGTFCGVASGISKCKQSTGDVQTVLVGAGKDVKIKASGVIYNASPRDQYGRTDDLTDETRLYPYGNRESTAYGLLKKGVISINNTNSKYDLRIYRTIDIKLEGTGTVASGVLTLTKGTSELKYGDKISIDNKIGYVSEVTSTISYKVVGLEDISSASEVTIKCQIDDPVYLNKAVTITPDKKGHFDKLSDLPFTTVPPQSGELSQLVGYIESPMHIRFDLTLQLDPIVL